MRLNSHDRIAFALNLVPKLQLGNEARKVTAGEVPLPGASPPARPAIVASGDLDTPDGAGVFTQSVGGDGGAACINRLPAGMHLPSYGFSTAGRHEPP